MRPYLFQKRKSLSHLSWGSDSKSPPPSCYPDPLHSWLRMPDLFICLYLPSCSPWYNPSLQSALGSRRLLSSWEPELTCTPSGMWSLDALPLSLWDAMPIPRTLSPNYLSLNFCFSSMFTFLHAHGYAPFPIRRYVPYVMLLFQFHALCCPVLQPIPLLSHTYICDALVSSSNHADQRSIPAYRQWMETPAIPFTSGSV